MLKRYFEKQKSKFYRSMQKRIVPVETAPDPNQFKLMKLMAARTVCMDRDFNRIPTLQHWTDDVLAEKLKTAQIGFYGNMANNHYLIVKALRKMGYQADLILEDNRLDAFTLNRPFWEDMPVSCNTYEAGLSAEADWQQPAYVRRVCYDDELGHRFANRMSAIPEVQALYLQEFGMALPEDKALLLAQMMGYWPYLLSMKRYDFVQFCNAPIMLAPFCPKPYLIIPAGGELRFNAFEESVKGLLYRAGFRQAVSVLNGDSGNPSYLKRLGEIDQTTIRWMIDGSIYPTAPDESLRQEWKQYYGGEHFILMPCRQAWADKGNDVFLRAFADVARSFPTWHLLLLSWGTDVDRSKALIQELELTDQVHWLPLLSKPMLRQNQATADLVVDHCLDFGVGAAPIEAMAAGSPVLMCQRGPYQTFIWGGEPPPLLTFDTPEILPERLHSLLANPAELREQGHRSRQWVQKHLNLVTGFDYHRQGYLKALKVSLLHAQKS